MLLLSIYLFIYLFMFEKQKLMILLLQINKCCHTLISLQFHFGKPLFLI